MKGTFAFQYPWVLLALVLIPALLLWLLVQQRRYWQDAFYFSQLSVLKQLRQQPHMVWHQRIVPGLLLLALATGILGLAYPVWKTQVVTQNNYLMLVLDISISMEATDISPNRLEAAKRAALRFVQDLPDEVKVGLAFFAGNNYLVSPPVEDHALVSAYLNSLEMKDLRQGTAIGDAMLMAIDSLHTAVHPPAQAGKAKPMPVNTPEGTIILLTDGENNLGISPIAAVEEAVKRDIKVFTIGMGEETGAYVRGGVFTHLDEPMLQTIAQRTGGQYYRVRAFRDFRDVYQKIGQKSLGFVEKKISLVPAFLGLTVLLVLGAFADGVHFRRF